LGFVNGNFKTSRKLCFSKTYLAKGIPDAIAGLELAIESLYPQTDFHKMGRKFYHRTIEENLKPNQEDIIRKLGVKL